MASGKPRGRENARDMVLSMGVMLALVAVILIVTYRPKNQSVEMVDYAGAVALATSQSQLPILVPEKLPSGSVVTRARFESESYGMAGDVRWYLGLRTGKNQYLALWQSNGTTGQIVRSVNGNGVCAGVVVIEGATWKKCEQSRPLTRVLYRVSGDVTSVVYGTTSWQALKSFANSLVSAKN